MYYNNRSAKTQNALEWSAQILHQLNKVEIQKKLKKARDFYNPKKHKYEINLKAYYPREILFTKDGQLSGKCHDISNWEKPLIDLIFLKKYFDKPSPYGCKNLNVDDKHLSKLISEKCLSKDGTFYIVVKLTIKEI